MSERRPESPQAASLRERAEKAFREMLDGSLENLDDLSPKTLRASLYELRVHQIELEMQNEELRRAKDELDATQARYFDLYDLAPVGYCTVSEKGLILEANLSAVTLLRVERGTLVGRQLSAFISKEGQELYYRCWMNLMDMRQPQECDLQMVRHDGAAFFAHLNFTAAADENGEPVCRVALIDVTAHKRAEDALRESEAQVRAITDSAQDAILMMDPAGRISYWNPAAERTFGYTSDEALGRNLHDLLVPEPYHSAYRAAYPEFQRTGQGNAVGKTVEMAAHRKDGREIAVALSMSAVALSGEWHSVGIVRDITERKLAEEASNRLAAIVQSSEDAIIGKDLNGVITSWNRGAEKIFGYTAAEMEGTSILRIIPADRQQEEHDILEKIRGGGSVEHLETLRQTKDGRQLDVSLTVSPIKDASGTVVGVSKVARDITFRKQTEALLRASEARFRSYFELPLHGTCITSPEKGWLQVNDRLCEILGYTRQEIFSKTWAEMTHPGDLAADVAQFDRILSGEIGQYHLEKRFIRKDGTVIWTEISVGCVRKSDGTVGHFICLMEDITKRKEMDAKLGEALACAEAANRAKSEFLSVVSHELRTPLNGVLGFAQLLTDSPLDIEQKDYAKTISKSGEHLLAIVNDILDFASIEAGSLATHVEPLVVADLVKTAEDLIRKTAADKGLELRCEVAADVPAQITGDKRRIRQILINLLGNAVKFTVSGSVLLRVATASVGGRRSLDFCVEDTGIGISPETLSRLFQPFVQADSKMNRAFGGTGLGLAISRRIAESMGGAITVASTPGMGSAFTFRFPLEPAPVRAELPPVQTGDMRMPSEGGIVLVVDDDNASGVVAVKMLQNLGYQAEFAASGAEAVEAFAPGKYLAILMDLRMPGMTGVDAVAIIRSRESGFRVPIIALSANVTSGSREICLAAGMDDFLAKPFKKVELAATLGRIVGPPL